MPCYIVRKPGLLCIKIRETNDGFTTKSGLRSTPSKNIILFLILHVGVESELRIDTTSNRESGTCRKMRLEPI